MRKDRYRVLVLTDHRGHSAENSLYALLSALVVHPRCAGVGVASRGVAQNALFFADRRADQLFAVDVSSDFVYDATGKIFSRGLRKVAASDYDIVFLRLPRPVPDAFLTWLPLAFGQHVLINHPLGILTTSTKAFLLNFPDLCPPIRLCKTEENVTEFLAEHPQLILKPLQDYGGRGILKVTEAAVDDGTQLHAWEAFLPQLRARFEQTPFLAMKFLSNVQQGDKRILVVNGEIQAASLRLPAEGSWLCNVAQGGRSVPAQPDADEAKIVAAIAPVLRQQGILICGVDTLVDDQGQRVLSEINTLSVGGFPQAEQQTGQPIISQTIEHFFNYADDTAK
ncbi:MAG: YheC/YheD family protein [Bacteroidota bacterium]